MCVSVCGRFKIRDPSLVPEWGISNDEFGDQSNSVVVPWAQVDCKYPYRDQTLCFSLLLSSSSRGSSTTVKVWTWKTSPTSLTVSRPTTAGYDRSTTLTTWFRYGSVDWGHQRGEESVQVDIIIKNKSTSCKTTKSCLFCLNTESAACFSAFLRNSFAYVCQIVFF